MRKGLGRLAPILFALISTTQATAVAGTLYREDFGSPGTLESLGFQDVMNWSKDDGAGRSIAGIGGGPHLTVSHVHRKVSGKKPKDAPLVVEWRMNLRTEVPFAPGAMEHLFSISGDPRFLGYAEYTLALVSEADEFGPFVSVELLNLPGGDTLGTGRLDGALPGFAWTTVRVEFHPALAGGELVRVRMDLGDGDGFAEILSVVPNWAMEESIFDYPLVNLRFIVNHSPSTALFFDDLRVFVGGDFVPEIGTATHVYDALERLDNRSFEPGGFPPEIGFVYDDNGNRVQRAVLGF